MGDVMDLSGASLKELTEEVLRRVPRDEHDKPKPVWPREVFNFQVNLEAIFPCVDGFPVRWRGRHVPEIGFIRRNTGRYKGYLWDVGGRRYPRESFGHCLQRHFQETLGVGISLAPGLSWNCPVLISQNGPEFIELLPDEFAGDEPSKWCEAPTYLVELESEDVTFGSTTHGGQEASQLLWYPADALPPKDNIAYGGYETVRTCAAWALAHLRG